MPSILFHASYFVSFPLLNKSIPTLTHFPLFFIMKNEASTRIVTEPWNFLLTIQFVPGIQTKLTRRTFNKCKLWANLVKLSGLPAPYSFPPPHFSQTPKNNPGVNLEGRGNGELTVSTVLLSFLLPYLFLFHTVAHLCPPLPLFSPQSSSPLFSSCCVILILHTLLLWTMNNAWCVRNPQSHAWLPAKITELASLLWRWIGERGISHRIS